MASYKQSDYEGLRRRCVELSQSGWKQLAIAQAFGLTQGWVSRTLTKYRQVGMGALQEGKRTGAPTRLSSQQLTDLVDQLSKGPEHHGFRGAVWTRPRVNEGGQRPIESQTGTSSSDLERLPAYRPDRTADAAEPGGTGLERSKAEFKESGFYYTRTPSRGRPWPIEAFAC